MVYGDGKQVRDILFVDDLLDAFLRVRDGIGQLAGRAFNVGGGPDNTLSLLELVEVIEGLAGRPPQLAFEGWRRADQRYFVSDTRALARATGWSAGTPARRGIERLHEWLVRESARRPKGALGAVEAAQ